MLPATSPARSSGPEAGVERIAVVRANALGDLMFALPALDALRAAYPEAEIVLIAQSWHAEFLAGRPSPVDRVVPVPGPLAVSPDLDRFFAAMRAERFDLALQMHGGGRDSNPFTRALGARLAVGLRASDADPLDRWIPYIYFQPEVCRYLEVAGLVGAAPVGFEPQVAVTARDVEESEGLVAPSPAPLVAIHPGATDVRRRWPAESFAAVARVLAARGARVVVTGTPPEAELTAGIAGDAGVEDLAGRLSLAGLTGLLSRCDLVVSNDTGPLHLAAAVGASTVGIFWCANLINGGPLTRQRHRPLASWRLTCPVCGRTNTSERCEHDPSFVADVSADEVIAAATELLEQRVAPGQRSSLGASTSRAGTVVGSSWW